MLTRSQLQRLAQRQRISLQALERDYIQHLLLMLLYNRSQELLFKGGTALRIVYRSGRFSEDLDFNSLLPVDQTKKLWEAVLKELYQFGVNAEIRNEWLSDVGFSFDVSFQGPLFDGRDRTKGKIRIDHNLRPEDVKTSRTLVLAEYDDTRPFVITVLSREHLLAEKVRALVLRGKPRDVYDIWILSAQGVRLDPALVTKKLAFVNAILTRPILEEALAQAEQEWERDLRPLLPQWIPWGDVIQQVRPVLDQLILSN